MNIYAERSLFLEQVTYYKEYFIGIGHAMNTVSSKLFANVTRRLACVERYAIL
jgi:hypothetical protein